MNAYLFRNIDSYYLVGADDKGEAEIELCKFLYDRLGKGNYIKQIKLVSEMPCYREGNFVIDVTVFNKD